MSPFCNRQLADQVRRHSQARGSARDVLIFLAESAHFQDYVCWPSVPTIAGHCRVSERTVQRALRRLVELGELTIDKRATEGWQTRLPNIYTVLEPQVREGDKMSPIRDKMTPEVSALELTRGFAAWEARGAYRSTLRAVE